MLSNDAASARRLLRHGNSDQDELCAMQFALAFSAMLSARNVALCLPLKKTRSTTKAHRSSGTCEARLVALIVLPTSDTSVLTFCLERCSP